ncbi:MAG: histidine kinase [Cyclobacteriaceae bacterium]
MVDLPNPQDVSFLIITATGLVSILVLCFLVFVFYYQKKLLQQQHTKQLLETKLQQQMLVGIIQGQEKERARLGREIHDGLGAQLASIKLMLENSQSSPDLSQKAQTEKRIIQLLQESIQELRSISQNLLPQPLIRFGFVKGMENYFKQITQPSQVVVHYHTNVKQLPLTPFQSLSLFRIIQELTRNAMEHGKARHFTISVNLNFHTLLLTLEENGQSYDWEQLKTNHTPARGSGIMNIETRIRLLSASLLHEPLYPGNRICITLALPITDDHPDS